MAFPLILEIGIVVSIAGIIALSLYILYSLDRLQTRVDSLEGILADMKGMKKEMSALLAQKDQSKASDHEPPGLDDGVLRIPNRNEKEISRIEKIETDLQTSNRKLEALADEKQSSSFRTNDRSNDMAETNRAMNNLAKKVSETNDRVDILQNDISKLEKKIQEIEEMITSMVRRAIQSKP